MSNTVKLSEIHTLFGREPGMTGLLGWCFDHLEAQHSGIAFYGVLQPVAVFDDATRDLIREAAELPFDTLMPDREETIPRRHGEAHWLPYITQMVFHAAKMKVESLENAFEALEGIEVVSIVGVPYHALASADTPTTFAMPLGCLGKEVLEQLVLVNALDDLDNPTARALYSNFDTTAVVFDAENVAPMGAQTAIALHDMSKAAQFGAVARDGSGAVFVLRDACGTNHSVAVSPAVLADLAKHLSQWADDHFVAAMSAMGVQE